MVSVRSKSTGQETNGPEDGLQFMWLGRARSARRIRASQERRHDPRRAGPSGYRRRRRARERPRLRSPMAALVAAIHVGRTAVRVERWLGSSRIFRASAQSPNWAWAIVRLLILRCRLQTTGACDTERSGKLL
jgi:hypothetical protein